MSIQSLTCPGVPVSGSGSKTPSASTQQVQTHSLCCPRVLGLTRGEEAHTAPPHLVLARASPGGAQMCPETLLGGNRLHPFSARHPLPLPEVESADSGCSPRRNLIFYFMLNFLGSRTRCLGGRCAGEGLAYLNLRRNLNVILLKKKYFHR